MDINLQIASGSFTNLIRKNHFAHKLLLFAYTTFITSTCFAKRRQNPPFALPNVAKNLPKVTFMIPYRTDIAAEAHRLWRDSARTTTQLSGVIADTSTLHDCTVERVEITSQQGADALSKPLGTYYTLSLTNLNNHDPQGFESALQAFRTLLSQLLSHSDGTTLVVGLGNRDITSDSLGSRTAERTLATRHINGGEAFDGLQSVAVFQPGVAGVTGMESVELIKAVVAAIKPACVIAVDALASANPERVCKTVQLSDSGIVPGSGIGNTRQAISFDSLGIPVIVVGIPTMIYAQSAFDKETYKDMIITPKDIDAQMKELSRFLAYGINLTLHESLNLADLRELIS